MLMRRWLFDTWWQVTCLTESHLLNCWWWFSHILLDTLASFILSIDWLIYSYSMWSLHVGGTIHSQGWVVPVTLW
jgi:hypothetical protein